MSRSVVLAVILLGLASRALARSALSLTVNSVATGAIQPGVPVLQVTLTNTSSEPVRFTTAHSPEVDYRFIVRRFDGVEMPKTPAGQIVSGDPHSPDVARMFPHGVLVYSYHPIDLPPGKTFVETINLPVLYDLPRGVHAESTEAISGQHLYLVSNSIRFEID